MEPLVKVESLVKYFPVRELAIRTRGWVHAVDEVTLCIENRQTLGLVGESGCGKTTLGRLILRLIEPTSGKIYFENHDIYRMNKEEIKEFRRKVSVVFQDPFTSLNPRMMIDDIIGEPLDAHGLAHSEERDNIILHLLERVGLEPEHMYRYPYEFSGGQRQRIAIARALAAKQKFIVLDEPTSALDVSVQAKILNLLRDLQDEYRLTYLLISHDLSSIQHISDSVAVMYVGKIVEIAKNEELFGAPLHPYTQTLLSAIPIPDPHVSMKAIIKGEVPSPINPPSGCRFHPRCPYSKPLCKKSEPKLVDIGNKHYVACHQAMLTE